MANNTELIEGPGLNLVPDPLLPKVSVEVDPAAVVMRELLNDAASPSGGAGAIKHNGALTYPIGSVGNVINDILAALGAGPGGSIAGASAYVHIRFSNDGGVTFTAGGGTTPGSYLGIYSSNNPTASNSVSAYIWVLIRGPQGATGPQGSQGPQGPQGTQGIPGPVGPSGLRTYFHVAYAESADGTVGFNQVGGTYIGTYSDTNPVDSSSPAAYVWRLFRGAQGPNGTQGIPGTPGANGQTPYLHIKYSNDGGTSFTANNGEDPGTWRGEYVDFNAADSNSPNAYTWVKVEGPQGAAGATGPAGPAGIQGPQGPQGIPGAAGATGPQGQTSYFHTAYASSSDGTVGFNFSSGLYIGTYVDFTPANSTNPASYTWRLFQGAQGPQGAQGIPGLNGANGQNQYLHIKYSNDGGASFTASAGETPGAFIGMYVDTTPADSTTPAAYTWALIQGSQGLQGVPGPAGSTGQPSYLHIKWSNDGGSTFTGNGGEDPGPFIGVVTNSNPVKPTTVIAYQWSLVRGPQGLQGIPGPAGANGQASYTHFKWSNDGGATFTGNGGEDPGRWLGVAVDSNPADPVSASAYTWTPVAVSELPGPATQLGYLRGYGEGYGSNGVVEALGYVEFRSDGSIWANNGANPGSKIGDWFTPNSSTQPPGTQHEILFTSDGGSPQGSPALGVWGSMSQSRYVSLLVTTTSLAYGSAAGSVYIRRASDNVTVASGDFAVSAYAQSGIAP